MRRAARKRPRRVIPDHRPSVVFGSHETFISWDTRLVWKTATMVLPNENESGSTWVLCWLPPVVYGSELIG